MKIYTYKTEVWDGPTCEKMVRHVAKDGLGTPYPFKGYIGPDSGPNAIGEMIRYNGGKAIEGEWVEAEFRPIPQVAAGFDIVRVPRWGWRIVTKS